MVFGWPDGGGLACVVGKEHVPLPDRLPTATAACTLPFGLSALLPQTPGKNAEGRRGGASTRAKADKSDKAEVPEAEDRRESVLWVEAVEACQFVSKSIHSYKQSHHDKFVG